MHPFISSVRLLCLLLTASPKPSHVCVATGLAWKLYIVHVLKRHAYHVSVPRRAVSLSSPPTLIAHKRTVAVQRRRGLVHQAQPRCGSWSPCRSFRPRGGTFGDPGISLLSHWGEKPFSPAGSKPPTPEPPPPALSCRMCRPPPPCDHGYRPSALCLFGENDPPPRPQQLIWAGCTSNLAVLFLLAIVIFLTLWCFLCNFIQAGC